MVIFFFRQKTADEMRISDWSSDVCSSDLLIVADIAVEAVRRDVGDDEFGAFGSKMAAEVVADMADALHGAAQSLEARDAEAVLRGRLHAPVDAVGGVGRRIAGAARAGAGGVRGLPAHHLVRGTATADHSHIGRHPV